MTPLKYITEQKVGTLKEIQDASKADPTFMSTIKAWAKEEMAHKGIEITEDVKKAA